MSAENLIGEEFEGAQWFHVRSSASSCDALASGATNLGPNSPDLPKLVDDHTQVPILGFLGEPRVDVLELNLALAQAGQ